jgi:acetylglutamate kinase
MPMNGGMQAKLESAMEALQTGTAEVVIAPGATSGIIEKLLAGNAVGTRLVAHSGVPQRA